MTEAKQPEALRLANSIAWMGTFTDHQREELDKAAAELRRQDARIAELEAQLSSSGFTAADMATASAQGFRDGAASVAASAGSEPVAWQYRSMPDVGGVWFECSKERADQRAAHPERWEVRPLYTHPAPQPAPVAHGDARVQGLIAAADYIDGPASGYAAEHSYTEPSPMAKVAAALRQKAEQEDAAYQARRSDQGLMESEWGPMEDAPPHEDPPMHVAVVEGDDTVRTLQWNRDVAAFAYPVGTLLYAAHPAAPVAQGDAEAAARWTTEQEHAIRQGHEIAASDGYFEVRPQIDSNDRRKVFQAGFERGWDAARKQGGANG